MPHTALQNRVDPWGTLCAVSNRGTLMGNRGILHDEFNQIVRPWAHKAWVTCLLSFKGIKRPRPFSQGNYSELFFLDEATAFSAGHRPCAYCQRERHLCFKETWLRANVEESTRPSVRMPDIDNVLHNERAIRGGGKRTFDAPLFDLPFGSMFEYEGNALLVAVRGYLPWSFEGYGAPRHIGSKTSVRVLTPESIVRAFSAGFVPNMHSSANG
jgi:hypothetical protein